ncbi:MAG: hypothetical protein U1G07_05815 [Verrucomicrobiota bacterium]
MDEILIQNAQAYAARHRLQLAERLGFGVHGIIFGTEGNLQTGDIATAIKVHRAKEPFLRELAVYQRLKAAKITKVLGFNVPQLLRHDDGTCIIEMSIVTRPFLLDFAGAYLELVPEFSDDVWVEWEAEKQEQFGVRWPLVKAVLAVLEEMDIHMVDVSPSNIAFVD